MRKGILFLTALIGFFLSSVFPSNYALAQSIYARPDETAYIEQLECPEADFSLLFEDEHQQLAALALRRWFVSEYAMQADWCDLMWNHKEVILLEPFVIRTDMPDDHHLKIFCSSAIASYGLFRGDGDTLYLAQNLDTVGLFEINCEYENGAWLPLSVTRFEDMNGELFPGAGIGTDGFPGLSDELAALIPDWGWSTGSIAERYLVLNQISAEVVDW